MPFFPGAFSGSHFYLAVSSFAMVSFGSRGSRISRSHLPISSSAKASLGSRVPAAAALICLLHPLQWFLSVHVFLWQRLSFAFLSLTAASLRPHFPAPACIPSPSFSPAAASITVALSSRLAFAWRNKPPLCPLFPRAFCPWAILADIKLHFAQYCLAL